MYDLAIEPELDSSYIQAAQAAIRPLLSRWIRQKLDEYLDCGRLAVQEHEDGSRWLVFRGDGAHEEDTTEAEGCPLPAGCGRLAGQG